MHAVSNILYPNIPEFLMIHCKMNIMAEKNTLETENDAIMVENITILADKNVKKQKFDTKLFYLNLKKT